MFVDSDDYKEGPTVSATQSDSCSSEYGTRGWAIYECNKNEDCTHLDNYGCDDENWRFCVNVDIKSHKNPSAATKSCTLLKTNLGKISLILTNYHFIVQN